MARPYKRVRELMREYDLTNETLAQEIGCATSTISNKLNGKYPWTSDEMWKIMDLTNQPEHELHRVFPRKGRNEEKLKGQIRRRSA